MIKKLFALFLISLPVVLFAYQQQYVSDGGNAPTQTAPQPSTMNSNSQSISSAKQQQQQSYKPYVPNLNSTIVNRPAAKKNNPVLRQQVKPSYVHPAFENQMVRKPNKGRASVYTANERQVWFKNCLGSIKDPKVKPYAMPFCSCGWKHISNGELPANLLSSSNSQDIAKANKLLQGISQECMVEVMSAR